MARKPTKRRGAFSAIPTESFADLAFLLIVFFLLATTLQQTDGFLTDIPAGRSSEETSEDTMPTVRLNEDSIQLDDDPVDFAELRLRLQELGLPAREDEERIVILQASEGTPYQRYFETMALITASGGVIAIMQEE